jgi:hypothetical protein
VPVLRKLRRAGKPFYLIAGRPAMEYIEDRYIISITGTHPAKVSGPLF